MHIEYIYIKCSLILSCAPSFSPPPSQREQSPAAGAQAGQGAAEAQRVVSIPHTQPIPFAISDLSPAQ